MKTRFCVCLGLVFIALLLLCCGVVPGQAQPQRTPVAQGEADPYLVELYGSTNYQNRIATWKLTPGVRMLKIAQFDKIPESIFLGAKVGVIIFPDADFSSRLQGHGGKFVSPGIELPTNRYLIPYFRVVNSNPTLWSKYRPFRPFSFILHRKDVGDFLGAVIADDQSYSNFYPLPEKPHESASIYYKITGKGPFTLELLPGGTGTMSLYPSLTPPNPNDIAITITTPEGATVRLPEPKSQTARFDLRSHGVQQISSLKLQYQGPITEHAYAEAQAVRAPAAPEVMKPQLSGTAPERPGLPPAVASTPPQATGTISLPPAPPPTGQPGPTRPVDVSGQWSSNRGLAYQVTQTRDSFEWTVRGSDERGRGQVRGSEVSAAWTGGAGRGSAQGRITAIDNSGRATQIDWDNGVRFSR